MPQLQFSVAALALLALADAAPSHHSSSSSSVAVPAPTGLTFSSGYDIMAGWANLSPYKEVPSFNVSKGVPRGCELSQVHVLHRHAERYPTSFYLDGGGIDDLNEKILNYTKKHNTTVIGKGPLSFLNDWHDIFGKDTLLPTGAATEATSGASIWSKYGRALYRAPPGAANWNESLNVYPNGTERPLPVFRTTTQARILESARWWLSGFFGNEGANSSYSKYDLVLTDEGHGFNNTLGADHSCTGDSGEGDKAALPYISTFTKTAVNRLSNFLPPDFNLTDLDVVAMLNMCPYEYAVLGSSSFCSLFTEQEWRDQAYNVDIQFYGSYGFGSPTGRAQGIGYVLELAARLEGKLIPTSDTSINTTTDGNPATFPLNQPLYMDMSHDTAIISVLTALGLKYFRYGPKGMPTDVKHEMPRGFKLNEVAPFGANLISEVWTCPKHTSFGELDGALYKNPNLSDTAGTKDYIRFVLNGAPVPLDGLDGCEGSNGFCPVKKFLKQVPALKKKADYQYACFSGYESGRQVGDGRPE